MEDHTSPFTGTFISEDLDHKNVRRLRYSFRKKFVHLTMMPVLKIPVSMSSKVICLFVPQ